MSELGYRAVACSMMMSLVLSFMYVMDHFFGKIKEPFGTITFYIVFGAAMICLITALVEGIGARL
jgi:hypothetical protein